MSQRGQSNASSVSSFRNCDTAVIPSDRSTENFVMDQNAGSCPTSVMSVPCSVVAIGRSLPSCRSISFAVHAAVA